MSNSCRDCRSKVNVTGSLGDLGTQTAVTLSIAGLSRWNTNWNVRNSYSYVATATKIRFHFHFLRSPDAAFGGFIGCLFNWKCKFSCRIISIVANYLKYNWFWDGDGIVISCCDFENSQISAKTHCWRRGWWYQVPFLVFITFAFIFQIIFILNNGTFLIINHLTNSAIPVTITF